MSWLLVKTSIKTFWVWLKEHWQIPFLILWSLLIYILTRRNTDALVEVMKAKRDSYKEQLEVLRSTHHDEILKRDKLSEKFEETLKEVEKNNSTREKKLTEKQKNEIKKVIIDSRGDPEKIKKRIEEEFGFKYVEKI